MINNTIFFIYTNIYYLFLFYITHIIKCTNLNLIINILENVPSQTAQNRLAMIKCLKLCRIEKIFQVYIN